MLILSIPNSLKILSSQSKYLKNEYSINLLKYFLIGKGPS